MEEFYLILKTLISLALVLLIMYIMLKIMQKYTKIGINHKQKDHTNLKIENILYIDDQTKIINISNNIGKNYIIAVGKQHGFVVDKYDNQENGDILQD